MVLEKLSTVTNDKPWKRSTFFSLMLVILEKFVEYDFVCPCKRWYTEFVFFYYLLMPTVFAFGFGIYLLHFWKKSEREESCCSCCKIKEGILKFLTFIAPPGIWVCLFLSDGRYVSCYETKLSAEYADSNDKPPWEWCSEIRNLTDDQKHVHNSFYNYKFIGLTLIVFLICFVAGICKYNNSESDQQYHQRDTERPIRTRGEVNERLSEL